MTAPSILSRTIAEPASHIEAREQRGQPDPVAALSAKLDQIIELLKPITEFTVAVAIDRAEHLARIAAAEKPAEKPAAEAPQGA